MATIDMFMLKSSQSTPRVREKLNESGLGDQTTQIVSVKDSKKRSLAKVKSKPRKKCKVDLVEMSEPVDEDDLIIVKVSEEVSLHTTVEISYQDFLSGSTTTSVIQSLSADLSADTCDSVSHVDAANTFTNSSSVSVTDTGNTCTTSVSVADTGSTFTTGSSVSVVDTRNTCTTYSSVSVAETGDTCTISSSVSVADTECTLSTMSSELVANTENTLTTVSCISFANEENTCTATNSVLSSDTPNTCSSSSSRSSDDTAGSCAVMKSLVVCEPTALLNRKCAFTVLRQPKASKDPSACFMISDNKGSDDEEEKLDASVTAGLPTKDIRNFFSKKARNETSESAVSCCFVKVQAEIHSEPHLFQLQSQLNVKEKAKSENKRCGRKQRNIVTYDDPTIEYIISDNDNKQIETLQESCTETKHVLLELSTDSVMLLENSVIENSEPSLTKEIVVSSPNISSPNTNKRHGRTGKARKDANSAVKDVPIKMNPKTVSEIEHNLKQMKVENKTKHGAQPVLEVEEQKVITKKLVCSQGRFVKLDDALSPLKRFV